MSDKKNYVEWSKFLEQHMPKLNKTLPTSKESDGEVIDYAEKLIENMKRSRS